MQQFSTKTTTIIFVCLFVVGAGLRTVNILRPVDTSSWRESDIASIARNYVREGMNPFYPRIDWRGDGPGFAEMELPLYPWMIAIGYKIFGVHEVIGRLISFAFSLVALFFFFKLARYLLPTKGAIISSLFFVLSPLVIGISNSLQPEGLMFCCYLLAAYYFVRWVDDESWKHYGIALAATALAILAKASAAHIGLFFLALILNKSGLRALVQPRNLLFGAIAMLPSLLWYRHAHHLWLTYGNSLGLSNETHWVGFDLFTNSSFILGIERAELFYAWMPTGLILAMLAIVIGGYTKAVKYSLYWLVSVVVFYLLAARTTGDSWAVYYHVVSIPVVAIMIGAGVDAITHLKYKRSLLIALGLASVGLVVLLLIAGLLHISSFDARLLVKLCILLGVSVSLLIVLFLRRREDELVIGTRYPTLNTLVVYFGIVCTAATFLFQIREVRSEFQARRAEGALKACADIFARALPEHVSIVASGGKCFDLTGYPVAYNSSYMFYWLDRKGTNICVEHQSVANLKLLSEHGVRYFVAEKEAIGMKPGFETELRKTFPVVMECNEVLLFELKTTPLVTQAGR